MGDHINLIFSFFFIFSSPLFLLQKPRPAQPRFLHFAGSAGGQLVTDPGRYRHASRVSLDLRLDVKKGGFFVSAHVTFLSPNKKVTKEVGTGEALKAVLPHSPAALPYGPHPARIFDGSQHLNGQDQITYLAKRWRGLRSPRPADFCRASTSSKNVGTLFA